MKKDTVILIMKGMGRSVGEGEDAKVWRANWAFGKGFELWVQRK